MSFALALLLLAASACDLKTRRIPNGLTAAGMLAGLAGHAYLDGLAGFLWALAGIAAVLPLLLLYAVRAFGAGDVKLLMAVGALMGPWFLLWTLLGAVFAAGLLALVVLVRRGRLTLPTPAKSARMPFAPAAALGAGFAFAHLHSLL
jgi:prepilin peptidase CpaA